MTLRLLVYILIGAALGAALFAQRALIRAARPAGHAAEPVALRQPEPAPEESFRLGPDRRLLLAVGDLHHILTGAPPAPAEASFDGRRWHVSHSGSEVGTIPDLANFPDLLGLLTAWAKRLGADSLIAPAGAGGEGRDSIAAELERLHATRAAALADRAWLAGDHSLGLLTLAGRALVLLEAQNMDQAGVGDPVAARALAVIAASRAVDREALARETALLADRMGYAATARSIARRLPLEDPVRLYVGGDEGRLAVLAARRNPSAEVRYLDLLLLARLREPERWSRRADRYFDDAALALPLIGAGIAAGRLDTQMPVAAGVMQAVQNDVRGLGIVSPSSLPAPGGTPAMNRLARRFEILMTAIRPIADGALIDRRVLRAHYRSSFYSALRSMSDRGAPAAAAIAAALAAAPDGPASDFATWHEHLAAARAGRGSTTLLARDLIGTRHFGPPLLLASYQALRVQPGVREGTLRRSAEALATRLDARPSHRERMGWIAWDDLLALGLAEDLLESAERDGGSADVESAARWAECRGDRQALLRLLYRPGLGGREKAAILDPLGTLPGADTTAIRLAYQRAISMHPTVWPLAEGFARALERRRDYADARGVAFAWLDRNADRAGRDEAAARSLAARLYEEEGRYGLGLAAVAPVVSTQQGEAMERAARLLDRLGRSEQAETLAVFAAQRHADDVGALALVAELYWRHGKPAAAALALAARSQSLNEDAWRSTIGPRFATCFRGHDEQGIAAADSLRARLFAAERLMPHVAAACADRGAFPLAFEIEWRTASAPRERFDHLMRLYHYLDLWQGEGPALSWIQPQLASATDPEVGRAGIAAYGEHADPVLWSLAPDPAGPFGEYHWVLRAASELRSVAGSGPERRGGGERRQALARYFSVSDGSFYRVLGRVLLGLEREESALALATTTRSRCEALYFLGVRAEAEGRYRDAARTYAGCLGTRQEENAEYRWARERLADWQERGMSLERIAALDGHPGALAATP